MRVGERDTVGHEHGHLHGMTKPILLSCLAVLVAAVVGVGGLVYIHDVDIAIAGFMWAALVELIALTN
jgi:hypothetical protein